MTPISGIDDSGWASAFSRLLRLGGVLSDTGADGSALLRNMRQLGIDPEETDRATLSHAVLDYVDGLLRLLRQRSDVTACLPKPFPESLKDEIGPRGAMVEEAKEAAKLRENRYASGEPGVAIAERPAVVCTCDNPVVMGCTDPGVVNTVLGTKKPVR